MFTNKKIKNMKKLLTILLIGLSFNGFSQQNELTWHTDVNQAVEFSVKQEKPMLMFFTGSDWCGWCKKLVKEVFVTSEFAKWAKDNVILVEDLMTDGGSKLKFFQALENAKCNTIALFVIFNYGIIELKNI